MGLSNRMNRASFKGKIVTGQGYNFGPPLLATKALRPS